MCVCSLGYARSQVVGAMYVYVWNETYVCAVSIYLWIAYLVRSGDVSPLVQEEGASGGLAHTGCNV